MYRTYDETILLYLRDVIFKSILIIGKVRLYNILTLILIVFIFCSTAMSQNLSGKKARVINLLKNKTDYPPGYRDYMSEDKMIARNADGWAFEAYNYRYTNISQRHLPVIFTKESFDKKVDSEVTYIINETGIPSASVAIVKNSKILYQHAYGNARINPPEKASLGMRYAIGSISKQFTAACILLLEQEGKLSLNDNISKWLPDLTDAHEVTIKEILSHTSGYQDFWPQDYVPPMMEKPMPPRKILDRWAKKPLDFKPGTEWQYSNTNFVIAGQIVQKITGEPFFKFLKQNILDPLKLKSAVNFDKGYLSDKDAFGYMRYGLGPLRPAPQEGSGWMSGAGELAMTAGDLAKWDISLIKQSLLSKKSYKQLETEVLLKNGLGTEYGLGVEVKLMDNHRMISHNGEVSGFVAYNAVFPDDSIAVVVLTNQDASHAAITIGKDISSMLLTKRDAQTAMRTEQARKIFAWLQHGKIDRTLFTADANAYFDSLALKDFRSGLEILGEPEEFFQISEKKRGGMLERSFSAVFPNRKLLIWTYEMPDGKLEQYLLRPD